MKENAALTEHYEQLRTSALQPDDMIERTPGFGVFKLNGMIEWMKTISALEPMTVQEAKHSFIESPEITSENRPVVVHILANMIQSSLGGRS
jgi:hypothetical protein